MNEDDTEWLAFTRFLRGGESRGIRPVKRLRVRKEMFTFPKGMDCWIAEDGHMYTLDRPYHGNPLVVQMYVKSTIDKFAGRFDAFFEELPMLDGDVADSKLDEGQRRLQS